jgi:hypothetical protein
MTIGVFKAPWGHPDVQGFVDRVGPVFGAADQSDGMVGRSQRDVDTLGRSWRELKIPDTYSEISDTALLPSTLSLWEDLESVAAFAYNGAHGEALSKRNDWFHHDVRPTYVAWWVETDAPVSPEDAAKRLDYLFQYGPTPYAFDFKQPFDADGNHAPLDREKLKQKREANTLNS